MKCGYCGYSDSKVVDSRLIEDINQIKRRRECLSCTKRFTTYEILENISILVIKSNGQRQAFDTSKIKKGLMKALEKRPIPLSEIDKITERIERKVFNMLDGEIKSEKIGSFVLEELKIIDPVAYIRFASVYLQFNDSDAFNKFIKQLEK
ncbi:MAG: transcriptional regulator NrdR [Firmicutes bacterium]|nr:transcriptional regulator NrdR [Bacillota bacterium]